MILTHTSAFDAMRKFLEDWWELTGKGDELGTLLSAMDGSMTSDGLPIDRAVWDSWMKSCEEYADSVS